MELIYINHGSGYKAFHETLLQRKQSQTDNFKKKLVLVKLPQKHLESERQP